MDVEVFFCGTLLACAVQGPRRFLADGPDFYAAFGRMVEAAGREPGPLVSDLDWMTEIDLVYGTRPWADRWIAFGLSARLLSLESPDLTWAVLRPSSENARRMLDRLPTDSDLDTAWFLLVATAFQSHPPPLPP